MAFLLVPYVAINRASRHGHLSSGGPVSSGIPKGGFSLKDRRDCHRFPHVVLCVGGEIELGVSGATQNRQFFWRGGDPLSP